jgi:DNA polymerase-4
MAERPRVIVHIDLDAFYAAVEALEHPELAGEPIIVGGSPEGRGVVMTASYEARRFGVHSAMPMFRALEKCPQAVVLPARHAEYRKRSRKVMAILNEVSTLVEQTSIDEAYVDLTDHVESWDAAIEKARQIQRRVKEQEGLSSSLGVATNKLVAKVASDRDKPGGLTVVPPGEEAAFLAPLSVRVLWGIGPVTAKKLADMGVDTVGDLASLSEAQLRERFGRHGTGMYRQARGIDRGQVQVEREAKSVSQETTFRQDLRDVNALEKQLKRLSTGVAQRLKRSERAAETVAIKLRYADFATLTRQMTLSVPTDDHEVIYQTALVLFHRTWQRGRPVRLLGVTGRHLSYPPRQLPLL